MKLINLAKLCKQDQEKIRDLTIPMIYRYSLKLIRNYPSIKKEVMREDLLLDYQEKKHLKDQKEINEAIFQARGFLSHLIQYELIRRELNRTDTNSLYHKFDFDTSNLGMDHLNKKKKDDNEFEYFQ